MVVTPDSDGGENMESCDGKIFVNPTEKDTDVFANVDSFHSCSNLFSDEEKLRSDPALRDVLNYFDVVVSEMGYEDADFFQNKEMQNDFKERLKEFVSYVDREIEEMRVIMAGNEPYTNFSEGWEDRARKACYFSFFTHYGAKRRGELCPKGEPLDYVHHTTRSAFNSLIRKIRFFDERTFLATICHDSLEDFQKGFLGVLGNEDGKGRISRKRNKEKVIPMFNRFFDDLDKEVGERDDETEVSIAELVDIVTRPDDCAGDRNRALLSVFEKIIAYPEEKQFSAMKAIIIKLSDRLDNIKTFTEGKNADQIEDETLIVFLAIAKEWGMWNVVDWFLDYIHLKDNVDARHAAMAHNRRIGDDRNAWSSENSEESSTAEQDSSMEICIERRFREEFNGLLSKELGGKKVVENEDYSLVFRPIPLRYQDLKTEKNAADPRNYVIAYPCDEGDEQLHEAMCNVFKAIFPAPLPATYKNEAHKPWFEKGIGSILMQNRNEISPYEHGMDNRVKELDSPPIKDARYAVVSNNPGYGIGLWSCFKSKAEACSALAGKPSISLGGGEAAEKAKEDMMDFIKGVGRDFAGIKEQYKTLIEKKRMLEDWLKLESSTISPTRNAICEIVDILCSADEESYVPEDDICFKFFMNKEITLSKVVEFLREIISRLSFSPFIVRGACVEVEIDGLLCRDGTFNENISDIYVPKDAPSWLALLYAKPKLLGSAPSGLTVFSADGDEKFFWDEEFGVLSNIENIEFSEGDVLTFKFDRGFESFDGFEIDEDIELDDIAFDHEWFFRQIGLIARFFEKYRSDLLDDDFASAA